MTVARYLCLALLQLPALARAQPPVTAMAFTPDNRQILVASQAGVSVHRVTDQQKVRTLGIELPQIHDIAFTPDGRSLVVAGGRPSEHGELVHLEWPSGTVLWRRVLHDDVIYRVAWQPQGELLATAGSDHRIVCVTPDTGETKHVLAGHSRPVLALTFLPDGQHLISGGVDHSLRVWDLTAGETIRILDQHTDEVRDVSRRPDRDVPPMIASVSADRTLRFWQPTLGRLVRFARLPARPLSVAWLSDGQRVAVGCEDGRVRIVHCETLEMVSDQIAAEGWIHEVETALGADQRVAAGGSRAQWTLLQPEDRVKPGP